MAMKPVRLFIVLVLTTTGGIGYWSVSENNGSVTTINNAFAFEYSSGWNVRRFRSTYPFQAFSSPRQVPTFGMKLTFSWYELISTRTFGRD